MTQKGVFPCPDCGRDVSKKAQFCPHCGCPIKKAKEKTNIGCGGYLALGFLVLLLVGLLEDNDAGSGATAAKEPPVPKTAEQIRKDRVGQAFSAWDGSHRTLERWIIKQLRDPDSYEHIETRFGDKGDHILVVTQYRARNGFGGYTVGSVTAKARIDGTLLEIVDGP